MDTTSSTGTNDFRINFRGLRYLIRDPQVSRGAKVVLLDLLLYAGVDNNTFPSEDLLARDLGITARQIRNLLNELRLNGVISWQRNETGRSNRYTFDEEIYYRNTRKVFSHKTGSGFPFNTGSIFPNNEDIEYRDIFKSQLNTGYIGNGSSEIHKEKAPDKLFIPCGKNGCVDGWIDLPNYEIKKCDCLISFEDQNK